MIFYVDADTSYKSRINGCQNLLESDTVIIYYNGNNNAFNKITPEKFKEDKQCKCKIRFRKVEKVSQSVDFAIAIDIAQNNTSELITIIGEDNHLNTIRSLLNKDNVSLATSIKDTFFNKLFEINDITEYITFIYNVYPKEIANQLVKNQIQMSTQLNKYGKEIQNRKEI